MKRRNYIDLVCAGVAASVAGCQELVNRDDRQTDTDNNSNQTETPAADIEPEFRLRSLEVPEKVQESEPIEIVIEIANIGSGDGTYEGIVETNRGTGAAIEVDIPAGSTRTVTESVSVYGGGFVEFTIGSLNDKTMIAPESTAPQVIKVSVVSEWEEFGDAYENSIQSASVGDVITVATRYDYWHGETGTLDIFIEYVFRDAAGSQVEVIQDDTERLSDQRGWDDWERGQPLRTDGWDAGEYTVAVRVRNERTNEVSDSKTETFQLT